MESATDPAGGEKQNVASLNDVPETSQSTPDDVEKQSTTSKHSKAEFEVTDAAAASSITSDVGPPADNEPPAVQYQSVFCNPLKVWRDGPIVDAGPPPDGGAAAWAQAIMAHLVGAVTWGYIASWGVYQTYYTTDLLKGMDPGTISWIGSIQQTLILFGGPLSGRLLDAGYFYPTYLTGSVLILIGIFMTSISKTFYQLLLAQGICYGLGCGIIYVSVMALQATYFVKRRSMAMSIVSAGTATGGVLFTVVVREALPRIGFGWSVRIVGFIMLAFLTLPLFIMRTRIPPRRTGAIIDKSAFHEPAFVLFIMSGFLGLLALNFVISYIGVYAEDFVGFRYIESVNLVLIIVAVGFPARLIMGYVADRWLGPTNIFTTMMLLNSVLIFGWIGIKSAAGLYVLAVLYGTATAGWQGLVAPSLSNMSPDLSKAGTRLGMIFFSCCWTALVGPPIAGALIVRDHNKYLYAQIFSGLVMGVGFFLMIAARVCRTGPHLFRKI